MPIGLPVVVSHIDAYYPLCHGRLKRFTYLSVSSCLPPSLSGPSHRLLFAISTSLAFFFFLLIGPRFLSFLDASLFQEINEANQTKDVWVRGELPNPAADGTGAGKGFLEGWLLAFSTKRGAMVADAPDALAAQVSFQRQVGVCLFVSGVINRRGVR